MDYCTLFPEGWWAACCMAHDLAYSGQVDRALADGQLFKCIAASDPTLIGGAASVIAAGVAWLGVRLFGGRWFKKSKPT